MAGERSGLLEGNVETTRLHRSARQLLAIACVSLAVGACDGGQEAPGRESDAVVPVPAADAQAVKNGARSIERDREIFDSTVARARREGLDTLPVGERLVVIGRWFVGAPYVPGTLEVEPERLVVNLQEFDCVTYVESMLAIARVLERPEPTFERFLGELRRIRYRQGELAGYPSRLHYFSDWIADNAELGIVRDVTSELGGVPLDERIDFMSSNRERYAGLRDDGDYDRIRAVEAAISERAIHYIPKTRIAEVAARIRNGDIIAATSAVEGLDVAHTGFAIWTEGELHFMNAPLVGRSVEISELPLAERIQNIAAQDGIMVVRPQ